jgi:chromosome segregation ATPase
MNSRASVKAPGASWIPVLAVIAVLNACTIAELQREEKADTEKVRQQTVAVQAEQARSDSLAQEQTQLTAELAQRQLSLNELNTRVAQLQAANARDAVANDEVRRQRSILIGKIHDTGVQLVALQQDTGNSSAQKQAQIDFLKRQIQDQLNLLLH